jgi:hypothetical protein
MMKKEVNKKFEILEDVVILFRDGKKENFNSIYIDKEFIYFGKIVDNREFVGIGGIPKNNIKLIENKNKKIILKKD